MTSGAHKGWDDVAAANLFGVIKRYIDGDTSAITGEEIDTVLPSLYNTKYRSVLVPPLEYEIAYRMMYDVPPDSLRAALGVGRSFALPAAGVAKARLKCRREVSSWTVNRGIITEPNRGFTRAGWDYTVPKAGKDLVVMVATPIQPEDRREASRTFWFNPDKIYDAIKDWHYESQREVISVVRSMPKCIVAWKGGDGNSTWLQILHRVSALMPSDMRGFASMYDRLAVASKLARKKSMAGAA